MIGKYLRPGISKIINPIARGLLKIGVTPNMVTVFGTVLNITLAIVFIAATNHIIIGSLLLGLTVFVDLVDGAMARQIGHGTPYGAILDATLDRVADGAVFGSILWWAMENRAGDTWLLITTLVTLVFSEVIYMPKHVQRLREFPSALVLLKGLNASLFPWSVCALPVSVFITMYGGCRTVLMPPCGFWPLVVFLPLFSVYM